jgi:hypothetical protein
MLIEEERREKDSGIDGNLHLFLPDLRRKRARSLARESQRARLAPGQWRESSREANGKEWPGGEGSLLLSGRGTPEVFVVVAWGSEQGLARAGGVVARLGPGVRGAHVLEGCGWPEVAGQMHRFVQSPQSVGVRRWSWWSNGQGSRGGCASGVLGVSPFRVR